MKERDECTVLPVTWLFQRLPSRRRPALWLRCPGSSHCVHRDSAQASGYFILSPLVVGPKHLHTKIYTIINYSPFISWYYSWNIPQIFFFFLAACRETGYIFYVFHLGIVKGIPNYNSKLQIIIKRGLGWDRTENCPGFSFSSVTESGDYPSFSPPAHPLILSVAPLPWSCLESIDLAGPNLTCRHGFLCVFLPVYFGLDQGARYWYLRLSFTDGFPISEASSKGTAPFVLRELRS